MFTHTTMERLPWMLSKLSTEQRATMPHPTPSLNRTLLCEVCPELNRFSRKIIKGTRHFFRGAALSASPVGAHEAAIQPLPLASPYS